MVRAYATGLGLTAPTVGTNATAIPGTDAIKQGALIMGVTNSAGQGEGVRVTDARVAPDLIGVFEIPFQVPSDAATGNNVSFSIGVIPVGASTPIYSATGCTLASPIDFSPAALRKPAMAFSGAPTRGPFFSSRASGWRTDTPCTASASRRGVTNALAPS